MPAYKYVIESVAIFPSVQAQTSKVQNAPTPDPAGADADDRFQAGFTPYSGGAGTSAIELQFLRCPDLCAPDQSAALTLLNAVAATVLAQGGASTLVVVPDIQPIYIPLPNNQHETIWQLGYLDGASRRALSFKTASGTFCYYYMWVRLRGPSSTPGV